ncbi:MAG: serine hydrolase domain-containing protein [Kofleriaceae bacterium]
MQTHDEVIGYVGLIARGDQIEVITHGVRERDNSPVQRDSIFRISSVTKLFTAATMLRLADDGIVDLAAPVERYVPELANRRVLRTVESELDDTVPITRSPTVKELLTFTWGFGMVMRMPGATPIQRAYQSLPLCQGEPPMPRKYAPPDEWIRAFATLPMIHQPGAQWMYHTGAEVAGIVIARAAGKSLGEVMHDRIFEPLGLRDTGFRVTKRDRFTAQYDHENKLVDPIDGEWMQPIPFESGGGGLVSTVDDLLAFGRALRDDARLAEIHRDQLTAEQRAVSDFVGHFEANSWGLCCSVYGDGSWGWDGGLGQVFRVTRSGTIGVLLTNKGFGSPVYPAVVTDFLAGV